jgi:glycosyltransferase involved in cell wall biosynthesis
MRVGIFTDNNFDMVNGVTTTLNALLEHLPSDISPRIYTAADLACDAPNYLALRSLGFGIPFYRDREMKMYLPRLWEYLKRVVSDRVDVLHLVTPGPMGLTALWIAKRTGLPLVGSFHTDLTAYARVLSGSEYVGRVMRLYMRWMYGHCARVLVPSAHTRELLIAAKTGGERIGLWTRGVDATNFSPTKRSKRLRDQWRVSDRRGAILYVGRVSREKGLGILPDVSRSLHQRGTDHRLIVTGDGPMRGDLVRTCPDAVFTGTLGGTDLAEAFASADVFLFPSRTDTAGNVVLEAQASGLPVVVSGEGGPRENMREGETGLICESTEPSAWATLLAEVLRDGARRDRMARAAREYAVSRRWEAAFEPLYRMYRDVAGSKPRGGANVHCAA